MTRRDLLITGASWTGLTVLTAGCSGARAPAARVDDGEELLDAGLGRIAARFPDTNIHRSNHTPMVIEVLALTGFADRIDGWLGENLEGFHRSTVSPRPIVGDDWGSALSQPARSGDWHSLFGRELERDGHAAVLGRWVPRFAPGLAGAATHGVIRTAHAARALERRDTPARRNELAIALAYWACVYQELPWDGTLSPEKSVADALARVKTRRPALAPPRGNIVSGLNTLSESPSFAPVAGLVDVSDPQAALSGITAAFARQYLRNPDRRVQFTHAVTAPSALRLLLPYLDEEAAATAVRYAWQAAAGIHAVYADPASGDREVRPGAVSEVMEHAARRGRTHGIKLSEACLRELALTDDPILLAAAWDAATAMDV